MRILTTFATLTLLAAPISAQERIPLSFDWPVGLRATVTTTSEQSTTAAGMEQSQRTVTSYVMETEDHPAGLRVTYRNGQLVETDAPVGGMEGADAFMRAIAEAPYDLVIDEEGTLVEVVRDSSTLGSLRAALDEMMAPLRSMPGAESMVGMFEGMLSDNALNAEVAQNWTSSVGLWAGDELVVGETVTSQEEAPFPLLENRTLLMDMQTTVEGRVPCRDGAPADGCVRVRVRSSPDPDDIRPMLEEMFTEMFGNSGAEVQFELGNFEQTATVEAVLEPGTLLPHSITVTSDADVEIAVMGQMLPTRQSTTSTIVYEWGDR